MIQTSSYWHSLLQHRPRKVINHLLQAEQDECIVLYNSCNLLDKLLLMAILLDTYRSLAAMSSSRASWSISAASPACAKLPVDLSAFVSSAGERWPSPSASRRWNASYTEVEGCSSTERHLGVGAWMCSLASHFGCQLGQHGIVLTSLLSSLVESRCHRLHSSDCLAFLLTKPHNCRSAYHKLITGYCKGGCLQAG